MIMKKNLKKNLSLNKNTIANLGIMELNAVKGGTGDTIESVVICPTNVGIFCEPTYENTGCSGLCPHTGGECFP